LFGALQQVAFAMQVPPQAYCPLGQAHEPPTPLHTCPPLQSVFEQQVAFAMHAEPQALYPLLHAVEQLPPAPEHTPVPLVGALQSAFVQQVAFAMHIAPQTLPPVVLSCVQVPVLSQTSLVQGLPSLAQARPVSARCSHAALSQTSLVQALPSSVQAVPFATPACVQLPLPSQTSLVHGLPSSVQAVPEALLICGPGSHSQISPIGIPGCGAGVFFARFFGVFVPRLGCL
jgi:hypothetical protein